MELNLGTLPAQPIQVERSEQGWATYSAKLENAQKAETVRDFPLQYFMLEIKGHYTIIPCLDACATAL